MLTIEILMFRLAVGTDIAAFLAADHRVQVEFFHLQPGILRRTTARGEGGEWLVIQMWGSAAEADAALALSQTDAVASEFRAMIDESSLRRNVYETLGG